MENNYERSNNRFWLGALFIVGGGLLLASKLGAPIPYWVFSWQVLLIAIGFYSGVHHRFQNGGWLIMMGIGTYFLLDEKILDANLHQYLLPVMIILVGVIFVLFPKSRGFSYKRKLKNRSWENKFQDDFPFNTGNSNTVVEGDDTLFVNSVFSGVKRNILSKNFKGGEITCVFGGVELNLMQADIQGTAVIKLEQVFGGLQLVLPTNWTVRNEIDGAFQGVNDKRRFLNTTDPDKVIVLKGSSVFAGVQIKSY